MMGMVLMIMMVDCSSALQQQDQQPKTPPNILLLIADDLGYGDLGAMGNRTLPTPNIDRLAAEGVSLTHHLTAASVCTPSRAAFLTGRLPVRYGMTSPGRNRVLFFVASSGGLPQTETTFARVLQQKANYSTALFGKWHLGLDCSTAGDGCHHPNSHGFGYFFGTPLTNLKDFGTDGESVITAYYPRLYLFLLTTALFGVGVGLVVRRTLQWNVASVILIGLFILGPGAVLLFQKNIRTLNAVLYRNSALIEQPLNLEGFTGRLVDEVEGFIRRHQRLQEERPQPFLVQVNFLKVHTAHFPSAPFAGRSRHGPYGDSVLELDAAVGRLLRLLAELKIDQQTLVYFSSDNGGHLEEVNSRTGRREGGSNGLLRGGKGHGAMEGGIRVPAFLRWSSVLEPRGKILDVPTSQMDLFPTLLEVAGVQQKEKEGANLDGKSILSLLVGNSTERRSPHQYLFHYCGTYLHGLRWIEDREHVWKVYFFTPKYKEEGGEEKCPFVCMCYGEEHVIEHRPPLVYNIAADLSERSSKGALAPGSEQYQRVIRQVERAVEEHRRSLSSSKEEEVVELQFSFRNTVWKPWLQPCCGGLLKACHCGGQ